MRGLPGAVFILDTRIERIAVQEATRVHVLAELMAGTRGAVASLPREAEELLTEVGDDRLGLVLDTALQQAGTLDELRDKWLPDKTNPVPELQP